MILKITIDKNKVAANEIDFPMLITEANLPTLFWDNVTSTGEDIWLVSGGGTKLKRELVDIDVEAHTIELWVKIPSLFSNQNTVIYLHYGEEGVSESNDTDTWNSAYKLVQHMTFDPHVVANQAMDSTGQSNDGAVQGTMLQPFSLIGSDAVGIGHDGITYGNGFYYIVGQNESIWKLLRTGNNLSISVTNIDFIAVYNALVGGSVDGIGGPAYYDGIIYIPVYENGVPGSQGIIKLNADTLVYIGFIDLTADGDLPRIDGLGIDGTYAYMVRYGTGVGEYDTIYKYNFPAWIDAEADIDVGVNVIGRAQGVYRRGNYLYVACRMGEIRKFKMDGTFIGEVVVSDDFGLDYGDTEGGGYDETRAEHVTLVVGGPDDQTVLFMQSREIALAKFGSCKHFDGINDYIDINEGVIYSGNEYTVEGWFYVDAAALGVRRSLWEDGGASWPIAADIRINDLWATSRKDAVNFPLDTNWAPTADTWYHIMVVCEEVAGSPELTIYINTAKYGPTTQGTVANLVANNGFHIGTYRSANGRWWGGLLDEIRISEEPKTQDYATTCYNNQNDPGSFYSVSVYITTRLRGKKFTGLYNTIGAFGRRLKSLIGAFPTSGWSAGEFYVKTYGIGVEEGGEAGPMLTAVLTGGISLTGLLSVGVDEGGPGLSVSSISNSISLMTVFACNIGLTATLTVRPINVDP